MPPPKESQALEEESQEEVEPEVRSPGSSLVESEELPYMATTEMYLCCWHQPPPSPWRDQSPVQEDTVAGEHTERTWLTNKQKNRTHYRFIVFLFTLSFICSISFRYPL